MNVKKFIKDNKKTIIIIAAGTTSLLVVYALGKKQAIKELQKGTVSVEWNFESGESLIGLFRKSQLPLLKEKGLIN